MAESEPDGSSSASRPEEASQGSGPGREPSGRPTSSTEDEAEEASVEHTQKHAEAVGEHSALMEPSGHRVHVQDNVSEGTSPCRPAP